eukprot:NODE_1336_length_1580_cov_42.935336_g1200_i0.p1 GENE.NODE_1336_length_1580_cov_42.935336_g1200_i0~~NODE_1336_length_1580_cov_42.935336_g1200_i0.p1  ORF type:complete len:346 (-),score=42.86 NODE_1336_length_1580_cov_42.935336_g1200_i0:338-1375(-)
MFYSEFEGSWPQVYDGISSMPPSYSGYVSRDGYPFTMPYEALDRGVYPYSEGDFIPTALDGPAYSYSYGSSPRFGEVHTHTSGSLRSPYRVDRPFSQPSATMKRSASAPIVPHGSPVQQSYRQIPQRSSSPNLQSNWRGTSPNETWKDSLYRPRTQRSPSRKRPVDQRPEWRGVDDAEYTAMWTDSDPFGNEGPVILTEEQRKQAHERLYRAAKQHRETMEMRRQAVQAEKEKPQYPQHRITKRQEKQMTERLAQASPGPRALSNEYETDQQKLTSRQYNDMMRRLTTPRPEPTPRPPQELRTDFPRLSAEQQERLVEKLSRRPAHWVPSQRHEETEPAGNWVKY